MAHNLSQDEMRTRIVVCGIGKAGLNALSHIEKEFRGDVLLIAVDSDESMLERVPASIRIHVGGTGPEKCCLKKTAVYAERMDQKTDDAIESAFENADLLLLLADLTEAAGCDAAPALATLARDKYALCTVTFALLPSSLESLPIGAPARLSFIDLEETVNAVVELSAELMPDHTNEGSELSRVRYSPGEVLATGAQTLISGLLRAKIGAFDCADLITVIGNEKRARMGFGAGTGPGRSLMALTEALECPLLDLPAPAQSPWILIVIYGGNDLMMKEVMQVAQTIQKHLPKEGKISCTVSIEEEDRQTLEVTIIGTGFNSRSLRDEKIS